VRERKIWRDSEQLFYVQSQEGAALETHTPSILSRVAYPKRPNHRPKDQSSSIGQVEGNRFCASLWQMSNTSETATFTILYGHVVG
jgi:hypothetical protein